MRKSFFISGILTLIIVVLVITGVVNYGSGNKTALAQGNSHYTGGDYQKALESYAAGLTKAPQDPVLNYNSGQALYSLKDYGQALGYYDKSEIKKIDKYLNMGNSCLRQGDAAGDENQKQQLYQKAMEIYLQGILEFPQEVSLKYNFEYVKEKLQQQQQNNNENQQNNEDKQNNEDQQGEENNSGQQGQDNQDNQDNQSGEGNQDNQEQNDSQESQNGEQGDEQESQQGDNQNSDEENQQGSQQETQSGQSGEDSSEEGQQGLDEIEQALRALEQQEEDSLKNNQAIRGSDKEDKYDW